jgi:hypothetical protein
VLNPPYETWAKPLEQHGGVPPGHTVFGSRDDSGRPRIPEYVYNADATELIWRWIERRCPGFGHLRFERPRRWWCVIAWGMAYDVEGTGATRAEAFCRAALALAEVLRQQSLLLEEMAEDERERLASASEDVDAPREPRPGPLRWPSRAARQDADHLGPRQSGGESAPASGAL